MLKLFPWHPVGFPFFMVGFIPLSFPSYPLVNIHSLRTGSHGPVEIVDLPIQNGDLPMKNGDLPMKHGDFPSFFVFLPGPVHPPRSKFRVKSPRVFGHGQAMKNMKIRRAQRWVLSGGRHCEASNDRILR